MDTSIFVKILLFVRPYVDRFIDIVFSFYFGVLRGYYKHVLPAAKNPLLLESATSLARKIRQRSATSEEIVRAFIERINEVNGIINAVVDTRFEDAIAEARQIDEDVKSGAVTEEIFAEKPFLGVPFTTKESTGCEGMKSSFGLLCRRNKIAEEDADIVVALKSAGAILIGVTNVPEINMSQETSSPVYGMTNNPYNTTRNVGGSSGGEAANIAACGSPFGLGTDIGGSVRNPAYMCGIVGHKPTNGLVPLKGMTYRTGSEEPTLVTAGTMTKYTEDIIPLYKILLGSNVDKVKLDENVDVRRLQIYYITQVDDLKMCAVGDDTKRAILRTVDYFKKNSDSPPQNLNMPDLKHGGQLWRYWMSREKTNFRKDLTNRQCEVNTRREVLKFFFGQSEYSIYTIAALLDPYILSPPNKEWAEELTKQITEKLTEKLGTNGVLLYPSSPWSARCHYSSVLRPYNYFYFAIWNALKFPVTQVPLGLDRDGVPLGIQVIAAPYQDHLCIAVAKEIEKAFGGYVPPFISKGTAIANGF